MIKWLLILAVLGGGVFAAQFYLKGNTKLFTFPTLKKDNGVLNKADNWIKDNVYPKFSGGVGQALNQGQENIQEEFENQKNNLGKKSSGAVKKFVAEKFLDYLGVAPEELAGQQCPK